MSEEQLLEEHEEVDQESGEEKLSGKPDYAIDENGSVLSKEEFRSILDNPERR